MIRKQLVAISQSIFVCLMFCIAVNAQDMSSQEFNLGNGEYLITSEFKTLDSPNPVIKTMPVSVTVRNGEVLIATSDTNPHLKIKPTVGKLIGNKFKAQILLGAIVIGEFTGKLVADDRIEGKLAYEFNALKTTGEWTMSPSKRSW
jgi:hypothetical protein